MPLLDALTQQQKSSLFQAVVTASIGRQFKTDAEWLRSKDLHIARGNALQLTNDKQEADALVERAGRIVVIILAAYREKVEKLPSSVTFRPAVN